TARGGDMTLSGFSAIATLRDVPAGRVEPPNADYADRFNRYGGAGYWRNINMTADFPSAATAIERLYEEVTGTAVDGTIAADPFALEAMLGVVGEVRVPRIGETVDAGSVVPFVTNEAYSRFRSPAVRKRLLGDVAGTVFERFLASPGGPLGFRALADAAAAGHLLMHSTDPREQRGLETAGVSGALGPATGDYLAVVGNNAAGNKADFYADRAIRYEVRLGAEGTGVGHATVEITNDAPKQGEPRYVIGPYSGEFDAGENVTLLDLYCGRECGVEEFRIDGGRATVGSEEELGHRVYPVRISIPSGATRVLDYGYQVPTAWAGDDVAGTYTLTFRGQTTIRPAALVVDVRAPEGMEIVAASPGMEWSGGRAVWRGSAPDLETFEVRFERPPLERIWHFLSRPVFRLG
ncbi:MAG TPA: DUF4012 domain-containing protein, partial [Actinomycetota bacterium]|nr:DUF4012 domain-containing protein [Actinomycetota bacterium]